MVSKRIQKALEGNSAIRAMFNEGREMAAKYGEENVFDYSLGNPATPAQKALNDLMAEVNAEIKFCITGERPAACTHDCSTCGGCHH